MTKEEFQARAKDFSKLAKQEDVFNKEIASSDARRTVKVEAIAKFDPTAAKIEAKYFAACKARDLCEMELAKHYASRIEK